MRTEETRRYQEAQSAAFAGEHMLAYLCALGAIVLVVLGLLEGFGVTDWFDAGLATFAAGTDTGEAAAGANDFWDGLLFLVPAGTFTLLAYYFHTNDHHRMRDLRTVDDRDKSMWGAEHLGAIVAALVAVVMVVIGLLLGFDAFDQGYTAEDGLLWQIGSLIPAGLSCVLHQLRHHQLSQEQDYIVSLVEDRVATRSTGTAPGSATTTAARDRGTYR
jgi:hypothetical protein